MPFEPALDDDHLDHFYYLRLMLLLFCPKRHQLPFRNTSFLILSFSFMFFCFRFLFKLEGALA